jgi:hypothetical protein
MDFECLDQLVKNVQHVDHIARARALALRCTNLWQLFDKVCGSSAWELSGQGHSRESSALLIYIVEGHKALAEHDLWSLELPESWKGEHWKSVDCQIAYGSSANCAYYRTLCAAVVLALMHSNNITISAKLLQWYQFKLKAEPFGASARQTERTICILQERIARLFAQLCSKIAYSLEENGNARSDGKGVLSGKTAAAYQLLWPTSQIAHSRLASPEQVLFAREMLKRIGKLFGIRTALWVYECPPPIFVAGM